MVKVIAYPVILCGSLEFKQTSCRLIRCLHFLIFAPADPVIRGVESAYFRHFRQLLMSYCLLGDLFAMSKVAKAAQVFDYINCRKCRKLSKVITFDIFDRQAGNVEAGGFPP